MKSFVDQKRAAYAAHHEKFDCACQSVALKRRVIAGGGVQYVQQCIQCGRAAGQPISKANALRSNGMNEPPAFDPQILERWEEAKKRAALAIERNFDRSAFFIDYDKYLQSDEWAARRTLVLKRAAGVCEGCGCDSPAQVHHLSYAHVGFEFLFELVALCDPCHQRIHAEE